MPERKFSAGSSYRYGFNGKENDNEVKGEGNQIDYGMRVLDPRLGRFLSIDPLTPKYPELTPYQYASNNPVAFIDLDGLEGVPHYGYFNEKDRAKLKPSQWYIVNGQVDEKSFATAAQHNTIHGNSQYYDGFTSKNRYYEWADKSINDQGVKSKWFSMDAKIVGPWEVGLTELDPGIFLSKTTKNFLNGIGDLVLKENMNVYSKLYTNGNYEGINGGMKLDAELLYNEQSKIQDFMSSTDIKTLDKALGEYNSGFKIFQAIKPSNHYLNVASGIIGGDIDFGSMKHRMIIGEVLMYQMNGAKIDDKAKKQINSDASAATARYYTETYGSDTKNKEDEN